MVAVAARWVAEQVRRLHAPGLRPRLLLIALLAVAPALGLTVHVYVERRNHDIGHAHANMKQKAQAIVGEYEPVLADTRGLLAAAAMLAREFGTDPARCNNLLSGLMQGYPEYIHLRVADAAGTVYCSAAPIPGTLSVSGEAWFQRALRMRGFAFGDFVADPTALTPVVVASTPIVGRNGDVVGVAFLGIGYVGFAQLLDTIGMPSGSVALLLDGKGTVLVRYPGPQKWVGRSLPDADIVLASLSGTGSGSAVILDVDGVRRIYGLASAVGETGEGILHVGVGVPYSVATGPANRALVRKLSVLAFVVLLTLAASHWWAARLVMRPVDALVASAQRLARGDLAARTGVSHGEGEIGRLARAFDEMAEGLQAGQAALRMRQEHLERLHGITRAALAAPDLQAALQTLADQLIGVIGADACYINLWDQARQCPTIGAATGLGPRAVPWVEVQPGEATITGSVLAAGRAIAFEDLSSTPQLSSRIAAAVGFRSALGVPLIAGEEKLGALLMSFNDPHRFTPDEIARAEQAGGITALALQRVILLEQARGQAEELERRVAERTAELQEANAELEAFGYSVAHDLRAPLRAMKGFGQALREDFAGRLDEDGQDYLRRIEAAAEEMDRLIQDLLAYSRLGCLEMRLQPVDLGRLVGDALDLLEEEIRERGAVVRVEEPLPAVVGHHAVLQQAIGNLLSNALKFMPPGVTPRVRVTAESRDGAVRLWVEDNGIGIAPEHQERIFRVFERLHGSEAYPGTGIGLAIVRRGIVRMGGRVGVESALGQGSRFWIELPEVTM